MSDEGKELGWESCRISLTHPFAVLCYPSVWGCSQPCVGQVSSAKGDVQSHPQPCIPLNYWWLMHRDKIFPSHCKSHKPKINVRKKCLTLKTESLIQGDLQFLLMLWSPLCLWNDSITVCYSLTFTHTSEGLICASDVFLKQFLLKYIF